MSSSPTRILSYLSYSKPMLLETPPQVILHSSQRLQLKPTRSNKPPNKLIRMAKQQISSPSMNTMTRRLRDLTIKVLMVVSKIRIRLTKVQYCLLQTSLHLSSHSKWCKWCSSNSSLRFSNTMVIKSIKVAINTNLLKLHFALSSLLLVTSMQPHRCSSCDRKT